MPDNSVEYITVCDFKELLANVYNSIGRMAIDEEGRNEIRKTIERYFLKVFT